MRATFDSYNEQIINNRLPVGYVFIGDSITQYWDLQTYFGRDKGNVVNRGIAGDITGNMLRRFPADVIQLKPRFVHIMGGTNNTMRLNAVDPRERRTPEQVYQEAVSTISAMVTESKMKGIFPIVGSILPTREGIPCYDFRILINCPDKNTKIRNELIVAINRSLQQLAANERILYANYHSRFTEADGMTLRPDLADDGLHPNVLGYNIMANVFNSMMMSIRSD